MAREAFEPSVLSRLREQVHYCPDSGVFTWKVSGRGHTKRVGGRIGRVNDNGYVNVKINGHMYLAHRLAWWLVHERWPHQEIDHINRIKSDNRIENLRECTRQQNRWNTVGNPKRRLKSSHKGITKDKKKWVAQIFVDGANRIIGRFDDEESAIVAYRKEALSLRGEFAKW